MRPILASLVVFYFAGTTLAESVPEFSLDYAKETSTEIVVVDAEGKVLESWRGELKAGEKLPFKADKRPQAVIEVAGLLESKIKEVTGQRRVLFLKFVRPGRGFDLAPPHYRPVSSLKEDISLATVWIEMGECFAIYQHINPGPGAFMHPLSIDEKRLKKEVEKANDASDR